MIKTPIKQVYFETQRLRQCTDTKPTYKPNKQEEHGRNVFTILGHCVDCVDCACEDLPDTSTEHDK